MKKIRSFVSGLVLGASAIVMGIWHWEKKNKKKFSTVMDSYYKKGIKYADNLMQEYGVITKEKLEEIKQQTKAYLENTLKIAESEVKEIMKELNPYIEKVAKKLPKKVGKKSSKK